MTKTFFIAALLFLSGCASSIMNSYVGHSLQEVMVKRGPPANAFDMGDGRRAFQWIFTKTRTTPTIVSNNGNAAVYGNSVNWSQNTQILGGKPITSSCAYTMYGRWNDERSLWVIEGFEKPNFMCE